MRVYLDTITDRAVRSAQWQARTARRAAALRAVTAALEADLAGRDPRRAKDGPGRWRVTALDGSERVTVAIVDAPIPRRWADPERLDVYVSRRDLLARGALERLREADRAVEGPAGEGPQRAHHAPAGRDQEHEAHVEPSDAARDHHAGQGRG